MSNLNSLLEDFYEEDNKNIKVPLDEEQISQIKSAIEEILAEFYNDEYNLGFSIADWDQDKELDSRFAFKYFPEEGEEGTADYSAERIEFVISGGENGSGHWEDYLDELSKIFEKIKDRIGWEPVIISAENDVCDDIFDVFIVIYPPNDSEDSVDNALDEDIEKHDKLNPKLFNEDKKLKPEIVEKINDIVSVFLDSLKEDNIKLKVDDIILVGSNVSYNYTKDSDLDIHIIADTNNLECPDNLYPLLYGAYKSLFNKKMDISFYGIPVEVYVETDDTPLRSNGIYSVKDNEWIKEPDIESIPDIDVDAVNEAVKPYEDRYKEIVENPSVEDIDQLITDIYDERKEGMSKEDGEFSKNNLVFKEFRNRGYLDDLKELRNQVLSKDLSLEQLKAEREFPLDENLSSSDIYAYRLKLQQITGHQGLVYQNGRFTINNIREDEVDMILQLLNRERNFVKNCHKVASGKWDFNHMKFMNMPSRYYTINGELNID